MYVATSKSLKRTSLAQTSTTFSYTEETRTVTSVRSPYVKPSSALMIRWCIGKRKDAV